MQEQCVAWESDRDAQEWRCEMDPRLGGDFGELARWSDEAVAVKIIAGRPPLSNVTAEIGYFWYK